MWMERPAPGTQPGFPSNYREATREALNEWRAAVGYFERVSDPDLVDFASFQIEAARRKYECLMRRARMEGGAAPQ